MWRKLLKRTPLAWFQVTREKTRLIVAIAGIAFADILIFVQMGFEGALYESATKPQQLLNADIVLVNPKFETLFSVRSFPRQRLYQASGTAGIKSINSLYISSAQWKNPETRKSRAILVFGVDPANPALDLPEIKQSVKELYILNTVLFDRAGRPEYGDVAAMLKQKPKVEAEVNNKLIQVKGIFTVGASFAADGNIIVSDSTFFNLFSDRRPDQIEVGLINLETNADISKVLTSLKNILPNDVRVLTRAEFAAVERQYWTEGSAIGFIFGLGSFVGFIVGVVIVYQILYSDVSDHLPEYATLKAMGYSDRYLLAVLFQQALLLAVLGFFPSLILTVGLYQLTYAATLLPIAMTVERAVTVLGLTIIMCTGSGTIAIGKLRSADPADIF
jgi:putative ABC transport system permease protein